MIPRKLWASLWLGCLLLTGCEIIGPDRTPAPQEEREEQPEPEIFVIVEQQPRLIGGMEGLQNSVVYPELARQAGVQGRVLVQLYVSEQGMPEEVSVVRGIGAGCDEAAVAAVEAARFEPALQRGQPVRVRITLLIRFQLG